MQSSRVSRRRLTPKFTNYLNNYKMTTSWLFLTIRLVPYVMSTRYKSSYDTNMTVSAPEVGRWVAPYLRTGGEGRARPHESENDMLNFPSRPLC